jgi:hypothetical protein
MKNYLICNIQDVTDVDGNILGKRVCDVADATFPVSNDYEWKQYAETFDVYTGAWYWSDKPTEYVAPVVAPTTAQTPTKEELLAQLQALQEQIQASE